MTIDSQDLELFHYGVKGMRWGIRSRRDKEGRSSKSKGVSKPRAFNDMTPEERKLADKILSKPRNRIEAYNRTAQWANEELIPKINHKYANEILEGADGKTTKAGKRYVREYELEFSKAFQRNQLDVIREKTKGRLNILPEPDEDWK